MASFLYTCLLWKKRQNARNSAVFWVILAKNSKKTEILSPEALKMHLEQIPKNLPLGVGKPYQKNGLKKLRSGLRRI